jgi:hypothetical protein
MKPKTRLQKAAIDHSGESPASFLLGAFWMRTQIREEIAEWLDCNGAIPSGTSFYAELMGCVDDAGREEL